MVAIGASIGCCDFLRLDNCLFVLEKSSIDFLHIDIMDGVFVKNFGIGTSLLRSIAAGTSMPLECHLMVDDILGCMGILKSFPIRRILFHVESLCNFQIKELIDLIHSKGIEAGISLNIETDVSMVAEYFEFIDKLQLMSVKPGFFGQNFNPSVLEKIKTAKNIADSKNTSLDIAIDGGVGYNEIQASLKAGASSFVAGTTSLFKKNETLETSCQRLIRFCANGCEFVDK